MALVYANVGPRDIRQIDQMRSMFMIMMHVIVRSIRSLTVYWNLFFLYLGS